MNAKDRARLERIQGEVSRYPPVEKSEPVSTRDMEAHLDQLDADLQAAIVFFQKGWLTWGASMGGDPARPKEQKPLENLKYPGDILPHWWYTCDCPEAERDRALELLRAVGGCIDYLRSQGWLDRYPANVEEVVYVLSEVRKQSIEIRADERE